MDGIPEAAMVEDDYGSLKYSKKKLSTGYRSEGKE